MIKKPVSCQSCNFKGDLRIPRGVKVKYVRCPVCSKVTLR